MISKTDFIGIPSTDSERSRRFYVETLGLRPDERGKFEFWAGETCFGIWEPARLGMEFAPQKNAHPALHVDDVAAARAELEAKGVEFAGETMDTGVCHMALFTDPDGNDLMLHHRYAPYEDQVTDFLVKRDDLRKCRVAESAQPDLEAGQALLAVKSFGLTANNVTYAVFGEAMSYWDFFPAPDGWGRVPMWGFAEVEESEAEGVVVGSRVYGYLPPSSHLVVTPVSVDGKGFVDGSPHRAALPSAYHRYLVTGPDAFYRPNTEAIQMLLRPLFFTSFLIDDQLDDEGLATRGPILISSASSKTAIAAAFLLSKREGIELVGLTSPRSVDFVEGLGIYGRTVAYDAIDSLERGAATFVDVAGDPTVRRAVHSHYGDELVHSMAVGATHWEGFGSDGAELGGPEGELPGPAPALFFAPDRVVKRSKDWGRAALEERVAAAWHPFCEWTGGWLETIPGQGFEAVESAYIDVLEGRVEPKRAHVLSLQ